MHNFMHSFYFYRFFKGLTTNLNIREGDLGLINLKYNVFFT